MFLYTLVLTNQALTPFFKKKILITFGHSCVFDCVSMHAGVYWEENGETDLYM